MACYQTYITGTGVTVMETIGLILFCFAMAFGVVYFTAWALKGIEVRCPHCSLGAEVNNFGCFKCSSCGAHFVVDQRGKLVANLQAMWKRSAAFALPGWLLVGLLSLAIGMQQIFLAFLLIEVAHYAVAARTKPFPQA
jgi:DNA-directed RNA polymerase subunit RPC12/RpoP